MADGRAWGALIRGAVDERIALMAPARRLRLLLTLRLLERYARGRSIHVLDAGCGDGLLTLAIARRHPRWALTGLDRREDLLSGARQRALARGVLNVRFERADLTEPLPGGGYDAVLAIECLSEIPDDRRALRMLAEATVPGGLLAVHVPERSWTPVLPGSATTWREEVRHGYSAESVAEMLRAVGVPSVEVRRTLRGTVTAAQELRDRLKTKPIGVRAVAFPAMVAAVRLERLGITWGPDRALLASGLRQDQRRGTAVG